MNRRENRKEIQKIVDKIVKEFHPEKVILFGSYAWGNPGPDSDVDLLVVAKTHHSTREMARMIDLSVWERRLPLDLLVYKPEQIKKRLSMRDFFVHDIVHRGRVLYGG